MEYVTAVAPYVVSATTDVGMLAGLRGFDKKYNVDYYEAIFYLINGVVSRIFDRMVVKPMDWGKGVNSAPVIGSMIAAAFNQVMPSVLKGNTLEVVMTTSSIYCIGDSFQYLASYAANPPK
jgi:hypothetical protein